ncbi:MAG: UDP-4-amino-4,6-dideoxy-N-acetyl-beta-L-altrosamine transaminase [Anaerolineae bacterium SM23_84]|jgi:dTDP-4-amino-4,6-dideoxygalactose transaminase|nr:MAG: UDP-4-amino-4,6-dideoxy-N-acetyl-beta-L-altrosamine transaminase [Anaerolineae bacterium SM23_84]
MRGRFLSFSPPLIGEEEINEVVHTLRSDWLTTGPKTRQFEREFAQFIGADAALAVSSGTHAMLVGLAALGIGHGDEVITTPMTFCSTVHVIEHVGARPRLVDVEPDTLNIDPQQVAHAVTPRTRAVMPVHLYGHPCEMDAVLDIAARHNLYVLEDAAHALPARYKGRMVGTLGTLTAFSFYATKNLTTGEGGMLTGSPKTIQHARVWSLHGMSRDAHQRHSAEGSWYYEVVLPGFKCNMTDIQAALGLQQLKKLPKFQKRRKEIVRRYNQVLAEYEELQIPVQRAGIDSAWHLYPLRLNLDRLTIDRARFIEELRVRNIGTSVHFIPIHIQPYYRDKYGYEPGDYPVAYGNYLRLITLPLNLRMTDSDVEDVLEAVSDVIKKNRR